jgi:hypothetical protein
MGFANLSWDWKITMVLGVNPSNTIQASPQKLCYYCNRTSKVKVGLITNIPGQRVEQVLFPGQRWMFWATPEAVLAVYESDDLTQPQVERIACKDLQVVENSNLA